MTQRPEDAETCPLCSGDGWYTPGKEPTDEQVDELLSDLQPELFWEGPDRKYLEEDVLPPLRKKVREWLANL